jgi:flavin-binding protein dodecin
MPAAEAAVSTVTYPRASPALCPCAADLPGYWLQSRSAPYVGANLSAVTIRGEYGSAVAQVPSQTRCEQRILCWRTGGSMAIHKVIEVISQSEKSWEDAAQGAVADAGKTVDGIKSIWIKNFEAVVKDNKIVEYRVNANITFEVKQ